METKGMHSLYTYCLSVFFDVGSVGKLYCSGLIVVYYLVDINEFNKN